MEVKQPVTEDATIKFLSGPLAGQTILLKAPMMTLGRGGQNDVVLLDQHISRHHASLHWQAGRWMVENLSQTNYVAVNHLRVAQAVLQSDDVVDLGSEIRFVFLVPKTVPNNATFSTQLIDNSTTAPTQLLDSPALSPLSADTDWSDQSDASKTIVAIETPAAHRGTPSLTVSSNIHSEVKTHPLNKPVLNLGRDSQNDIMIAEPTISAWHAQIVREGETFLFVHPHPSRERTLNGLWYQGQRIPGDQVFRKPLMRGDILRIGDEHGTLITLTYDDGSGITEETLPALPPIPLTEQKLSIGRIAGNTLVLNHPQVSAHHALLEKADGGYRITDLNSTNHVYVNGQPTTNQMLHTGDEIRIGPYRLIYTGVELRQYDESNHIRIDALNLKKSGNNQVILLNDISLTIPPRKFVALVGGSGAGKSTLLDALNGLRPAQEGKVLYNGEDYYSNLSAFNTQLGYVPQDDIVHRDLTVEHALYYAARLRLPGDFTREQIQWRIDEVLEDVEMTDRRNLLVSKLSGGQRKRVSIALELLANPSVFFLDEPTSGLDPGLDRKMMLLLRRLADKGHTVILVTHATTNINACDYVCFLAQGGRLAYFGPPNAAKAYFERTDFAEIYSTLEPTAEQPDIPAQAETRFLASKDFQQYVARPLTEGQKQTRSEQQAQPEPHRRKARSGHGWSQFLLLSRRYLELLRNDVGNLLILLLQAPVIAIMLVLMARFEIGTGIFNANQLVQCSPQTLTASGPLVVPQPQPTKTIDCQQVLNFLVHNPQGQAYAHSLGGAQQALQNFLVYGPGIDAQKVLFIMAFACVLFGCINGVREIVKEAPIYRRERAVNLGILPYMFSKIVVLGMLCLLQSLVFVVVIELGEPLRQGIFLPPFLETYITLCLTSLAGMMTGLAISAIAPNNDRAISFVPIILLPQVIFSGAIIPLKDWFTQIVAVIFPTRWAMAALGTSIGLHADKVGGDRLFGSDPTYHDTLFSVYSQSDALHRMILSWAVLAVVIIALAIVIWIFLKRKDIRA